MLCNSILEPSEKETRVKEMNLFISNVKFTPSQFKYFALAILKIIKQSLTANLERN